MLVEIEIIPMSDTETELREQFMDVFGEADYPVTGPFDLIPVLPRGPMTTFKAGDVKVSATSLHNYAGYMDFPYQDVDGLVGDIMEAVRNEEDL